MDDCRLLVLSILTQRWRQNRRPRLLFAVDFVNVTAVLGRAAAAADVIRPPIRLAMCHHLSNAYRIVLKAYFQCKNP